MFLKIMGIYITKVLFLTQVLKMWIFQILLI